AGYGVTVSQSGVMNYLNKRNIEYQIISHIPAYTSHNTARATHVPESELAKTLVVRAGQQFWMAVLPADHRLSERLLKRVLEVHHVHLATEEELGALFPDCEVGAMPPFGNLYGLPVIVDQSLTERGEIVFNACTHTEAVRMKFADFERLVKPLIGEIAERPIGRGEHAPEYRFEANYPDDRNNMMS
ncbi:MAG: YbaK/EbsC family protein, partial [Bacteroidota bacterium]